jgi:hypothetical protein
MSDQIDDTEGGDEVVGLHAKSWQFFTLSSPRDIFVVVTVLTISIYTPGSLSQFGHLCTVGRRT